MKKTLAIFAATVFASIGLNVFASNISSYTPASTSYINAISAPSKRLKASITASSMSFQLGDIKGWNGNNLTAADFGAQAYAVFRNDSNSAIEIMEIDPTTIASTSITIIARGLSFNGDLTSSSTANKLSWIKNTTIVELGTDAPQTLMHAVQIGGDQNINGAKTFLTLPSAASSISTSSFTTYNFATKQYVDAQTIAGAPAASTIQPGIAFIATGSQLFFNLSSGGYSSVPPSGLFTGTASSGMLYSVPVALNGLLPTGFVNHADTSTWTNLNVSSATFSGTANFTSAVRFSTSTYVMGAYFAGSQNGAAASSSWTVPSNVTSVTIYAFGAGNGTIAGGYSVGTLAVSSGTKYTVQFAGHGTTAGDSAHTGGNYAALFTSSTTPVNTSTIIIIAGGAGGTGASGAGGAGGGTTGANGVGATAGLGGSQSAGGATGGCDSGAGSFLTGGAAAGGGGDGDGSGGGGLYGGGSGANSRCGTAGAGGGGSGFVSTSLTSATTTQALGNTGAPTLYIVYNIAQPALSPNAGTVQWGGTSTIPTINFSSAFNSVPSCSLGTNSPSNTPYISALTTSSITLAYNTFVQNMWISYTCF